ncbi:pyridoxal 5'-phosphate synthase [Streptomyces sp. CBMA152]|uniref:pyridoxine/pyridoxamine 5'-phosphate oxidase n=1 Tax=Streptomyces sp. CBMA152 TaxID=1896312 RepID=UPI0016617930|nr:pyridoxal 5'-phosphate synthase [Streptomyces sp. CBMA152]MBD0746843.1 oxidase [Streptomyces sp. CBMA152]
MAASEDTTNVRTWLRSLDAFPSRLPTFDPASAPAEPVELFLAWLTEAVQAGEPGPHAMTLSTVDEQGDPWARVLILKNVDAAGWQFAAHAGSPKGQQLSAHPRAALTFYWPGRGRQIRIRGAVTTGSADSNAADFLARSPSARAEALLGHQSQHLDTLAHRDAAIAESARRVDQNPQLLAEDWTLYTLAPVSVEFWQAAETRVHTRLRYERARPDAEWERHLLWP